MKSAKVTLVEVPPDWREAPPPVLSPTLRGALEAFDEKGYHGTSVRDIADRVGMTIPGLYYHHKNKEEMLFALLDASIEHLTNMCRVAVADAGDAGDMFLNLVECISLYMAQVSMLARLDSEIRSLDSDSRKVYSAKRRAVETMLKDALQSGVDEGLFQPQDASKTARALLGMYQAIPVWYRSDGKRTPHAIASDYREISAYAARATDPVLDKASAR